MSFLIPDEIPEVLKKTNGYSLLVKGGPGMGKSTFALTLMVEKANVNGFYVSTRVGAHKIYEQFPWAKKYVRAENIVDATELFSEPTITAGLDQEGDLDFIKEIRSRVEGLEDPTVIIDTWDAIHTSLGDAAVHAEKAITDWPREQDLTLVLVSEFLDSRVLEFLVDGVVTLSDREVDGRRIREVRLDKLRECEIRNLKYVYTLKNGIFRRFPSLKIKEPQVCKPWIPFSDERSPFYSGSPELDQAICSALRGGSILLELREDVPHEWANILVRPFVLNFIAKDRGVIIVPPSDVPPQQIKQDLTKYVREEKFDTFATVFTYSSAMDNSPFTVGMWEKSEAEEEALWTQTEEQKRSESNGPVLRVVNVDNIEQHRDAGAALRRCAQQVSLGRVNQDMTFLVARESLESARKLRGMCDIHIKMIEMYGACYVYGVMPRTGFYNVDIDISQGYPVPEMTPVV